MRLIDGDALYDEISKGQLSALGFEGYDDYTNINNIDDALDAVKYAPTVNQWIPCSERLPEKSGWYLCSYESKLVQSTVFYDGGWFNANVDVNNVIAWMPLPEPYKGVTE